jgi:hypothetical protein
MPSLDSCISNLYEPGNIPGSSGTPPTDPVLTSTSLITFGGAGSLRATATRVQTTASVQLRFGGTGSLSVNAIVV